MAVVKETRDFEEHHDSSALPTLAHRETLPRRRTKLRSVFSSHSLAEDWNERKERRELSKKEKEEYKKEKQEQKKDKKTGWVHPSVPSIVSSGRDKSWRTVWINEEETEVHFDQSVKI